MIKNTVFLEIFDVMDSNNVRLRSKDLIKRGNTHNIISKIKETGAVQDCTFYYTANFSGTRNQLDGVYTSQFCSRFNKKISLTTLFNSSQN